MASPFSRPFNTRFVDDLGTEIATIYVGPNRKKFTVHKNLLTSQSEYFDKALNGSFKEAEENSIHLEEDDPSAIALLVGWLYRGEIPGPALTSIHVEAFPPSTVDKVVEPVGGTSTEVDAYTEQEPGQFGQVIINCFQSITCHPQYKGYSAEELRLADYTEGRRYKSGSESAADMLPDVSSSGLHSRQRNFPVRPAQTIPVVQPVLPAVHGGVTHSTSDPRQGLFGSSALVGRGIGGVAFSAANSISGGGLLGRDPLQNGAGTGDVAQSAVNSTASRSSLFGNSSPAGFSLFGPSTAAPSSGVSVTSGSRAQSSDDTTQSTSSTMAGVYSPSPLSYPATSSSDLVDSALAANVTRMALYISPQQRAILAQRRAVLATAAQPSQDSDGSSGDEFEWNEATTVQSMPPPQATFASQALPITQQPSHAPLHAFPQPLTTMLQLPSIPPPSNPRSVTPPSGFSRFSPAKFGNHNTTRSPFTNNAPHYTTPSHQLALLNLTLFAEGACWPTLYNAAMTFYVCGERTLTRPPPLDHVTLIYERTHDESSLRRRAVDCLAAHKGDFEMGGYMGLLVDYDGFLEGVLTKLRENAQQGEEQAPGWDGAGGLKYRMQEHGKKNPFGGGKDKGRAD